MGMCGFRLDKLAGCKAIASMMRSCLIFKTASCNLILRCIFIAG